MSRSRRLHLDHISVAIDLTTECLLGTPEDDLIADCQIKRTILRDLEPIGAKEPEHVADLAMAEIYT